MATFNDGDVLTAAALEKLVLRWATTAGRVAYATRADGSEQLIYGDTGRRVLTTLLNMPSFDTGRDNYAEIRRTGCDVELILYVYPRTDVISGFTAITIPEGFRSPSAYPAQPLLSEDAAIARPCGITFSNNNVKVWSTFASVAKLSGRLSWKTTDNWPTNPLPGTATGTIPTT
jgi:hypothetical protein